MLSGREAEIKMKQCYPQRLYFVGGCNMYSDKYTEYLQCNLGEVSSDWEGFLEEVALEYVLKATRESKRPK